MDVLATVVVSCEVEEEAVTLFLVAEATGASLFADSAIGH